MQIWVRIHRPYEPLVWTLIGKKILLCLYSLKDASLGSAHFRMLCCEVKRGS
jgi:hypothetical protein